MTHVIVDDDRLTALLWLLSLCEPDAFCNFAVTVKEVRSMAAELLRERERGHEHCPCCDGDHP